MTKVKLDRVTIERDAVEVELPDVCPKCGIAFASDGDEEHVPLREMQLVTSLQMCAIVGEEIGNYDDCDDFAESAPVVGFACCCGYELVCEEQHVGGAACNTACGDACNGDPDSFLHHSNRVPTIADALRVLRNALGTRGEGRDVENALARLEHFLHVSDLDLDKPLGAADAKQG